MRGRRSTMAPEDEMKLEEVPDREESPDDDMRIYLTGRVEGILWRGPKGRCSRKSGRRSPAALSSLRTAMSIQ